MTQTFGKDKTFGNVYAESLATPRGRFAWPSLTAPKPVQAGREGKPRYEVSIILPKDNPKVASWIKAMRAQAEEMFKVFNQGRSPKLAFDSAEIKNIQDGDNYDLEKYPYYENSWVLCPKNANAPQVVDDAKGDIEASFIKGGMIGKCLITPLVTAHGLSFKLDVVQFLKDDEVRFAGGTKNPKDLLAKLGDDEDEDTSTQNASEDTEEDDDAEEEKKAIGNKMRKVPAAEAAATKEAVVMKGKKAALARL